MHQTNSSGSEPAPSANAGRSYFGAGSELKGDLHASGLVELFGHLEGMVTADAVMIEEQGSARGELHAADVTIKGQFEGKIFGGDVKLNSGAKVSGEILYETLSIDSGAEVNSKCTVKKSA
jgi:cytoskeletal protein CcmA (bactofilin family)